MKQWLAYRFYLPAVLLGCSMVFHQRARDTELPLLAKLFSQYTGTCTGYGFFGPRVGSAYVLEVDCYNQQGILVAQLNMPPLRHAEGWKRYANFLDVFEAFVGEETNSGNNRKRRYAGAVAQSIARQLVQLHDLSPHHIRYRVGVSKTPARANPSVAEFLACYENSYHYIDQS